MRKGTSGYYNDCVKFYEEASKKRIKGKDNKKIYCILYVISHLLNYTQYIIIGSISLKLRYPDFRDTHDFDIIFTDKKIPIELLGGFKYFLEVDLKIKFDNLSPIKDYGRKFSLIEFHGLKIPTSYAEDVRSAKMFYLEKNKGKEYKNREKHEKDIEFINSKIGKGW